MAMPYIPPATATTTTTTQRSALHTTSIRLSDEKETDTASTTAAPTPRGKKTMSFHDYKILNKRVNRLSWIVKIPSYFAGVAVIVNIFPDLFAPPQPDEEVKLIFDTVDPMVAAGLGAMAGGFTCVALSGVGK